MRVRRGLCLLVWIPFLLMGARSKRKPKSLNLSPVLLVEEQRKIAKSLYDHLCGKNAVWKAKMFANSHTLRSSIQGKKKKNEVEWSESLNPVVAASVMLAKGGQAQKKIVQRSFTFSSIQADCHYISQNKKIKATHRISGGPISIKLNADGKMSAWPVQWPKEFQVKTLYEKDGLCCVRKYKLPINPFLVFPIEPIEKK